MVGIGTGAAAGALLLGTLVSGSSSAQGASWGSAPTGGTKIQGGTVTWAEQPSSAPNFIYPFAPASFYSVANTGEFQNMMYRPLYWFGVAKQPTINPNLSLARRPKFSKALRRITITLNRGIWPNEEHNWAHDAAGVGIPDDIPSVTVTSPSQLIIRVAFAVNPPWFTYNMLSQITPLPKAWDITHTGAAPGSGGCSTGPYGAPSTDAACRAVWNYMTAQAGYDPASPGTNTALGTYASNPLWQVVDGPWRLDGFNPDGEAPLVPNGPYSRQAPPAFAKFVEVPFASASAELSPLDDGQLSVGYLPLSN